MTGHVLRLLGIERTVAALDIALPFYRDRLGFVGGEITEVQSPWRDLLGGGPAREICLQLGDEKIWLTEFAKAGAPYPADGCSSDLWFQHFAIAVPDASALYVDLVRNVDPITQGAPLRLPPNTGGVTAWKFRDPDRHPLELLQFPPGIGDAKWHRPAGGRRTLGIDHAAISVADAEASIAFYRDGLGLTLAARGVNRGPEQESLDALPDDIVTVVALGPAAQATPHLELLAYQNPAGRRPPAPVEPWDIAGDRLVFVVDDLAAILARLPAAALVRRVEGNDYTAALIRDPDGHFLILTDCRQA